MAAAGLATLDPGQFETIDTQLAVANLLTGSIHGYKFNDLNDNNVDDGDPRLEGVTFTLTGDADGDGTTDTLTDVTGVDGRYDFDDLFPGDYILVETPPASAVDPTPTPINLTVQSGEELVAAAGLATLDPGQFETIDTQLAVANLLTGSIHGYKFNDLNDNNVDDGDPRLEGVTFTLTGDADGDGTTDTLTDVTGVDGRYDFDDLFPGDYILVETPPASAVDPTPTPINVTVQSGEELVAAAGLATLDPGQFETIDTQLAVANLLTGSIHGYKFNDLNDNNVDDGEPRLAGVTFTLTGDADGDGTTDTLTDVTGVDGRYDFDDLFPGDYVLVETPPASAVDQTPTPINLTVQSGEELVAAAGLATLDPGQFETIDTQLAVANLLLGVLRGTKFHDLNADGTDGGGTDPRLEGWEIRAYADLNGNGQLDNADIAGGVISDDVTNMDGDYELFLEPGDYVVVEVLQQDWNQSHPADSVNGVEPGLGEFGHAITLVSGQVLEDVDFGNWQEATVTGRKFDDLDANGDDDSGTDPGLEGWEIRAYADLNGNEQLDATEIAAGVVSSATTDSNGNYTLSLSPGDYILVEVLQAGRIQTHPADTVNLIDSTLGEFGHAVTLVSGQLDEENDFGNSLEERPDALILGQKFNDRDGDGVQDPNGADNIAGNADDEVGLPGWEIRIFVDENNNGVLDQAEFDANPFPNSATTDADGIWDLTIPGELLPLNLIIVEVQQAGWNQTDVLGPATIDPGAVSVPSSLVLSGGLNTGSLVLGERGYAIAGIEDGFEVSAVDFGNMQQELADATVSGSKVATTCDPARPTKRCFLVSAQDEPVADWQIRLYVDDNGNGALDQAEFDANPFPTPATTQQDGSWDFVIPGTLLPLDLIVVEELQDGWTQSSSGGPASVSPAGSVVPSSLVLATGLNTGSLELGERGYAIEEVVDGTEVTDVDFSNIRIAGTTTASNRSSDEGGGEGELASVAPQTTGAGEGESLFPTAGQSPVSSGLLATSDASSVDDAASDGESRDEVFALMDRDPRFLRRLFLASRFGDI